MLKGLVVVLALERAWSLARRSPEAPRQRSFLGGKAKKAWKPAVVDAAGRPGDVPVVVHECEDLVVVNKPAGWLTHDDGTGDRPSVSGFLREVVSPTTRSGELGVHQRLDVDCSGVLCFAVSDAGNAALRDAFESRTASKAYVAVVDEDAAPLAARGRLSGPGRNRALQRHFNSCVERSHRSHETRIHPWRDLEER